MKHEELNNLLALIDAHPNGQAVGQTRLQMTVYLLQRLGYPTGYIYRLHFRPLWSDELQGDIDALESVGSVVQEGRGTEQARYTVISPLYGSALPDVSRFKPAIDVFAGADPTVMQVAATCVEYHARERREDSMLYMLRLKMGAKCDDGREEQAMVLLRDMGLVKKSLISRIKSASVLSLAG